MKNYNLDNASTEFEVENENWCDYEESYEDARHYEEFQDCYAQEVEGYSDEEINEVFEGDPDMYWNID